MRKSRRRGSESTRGRGRREGGDDVGQSVELIVTVDIDRDAMGKSQSHLCPRLGW